MAEGASAPCTTKSFDCLLASEQLRSVEALAFPKEFARPEMLTRFQNQY